MDKNFFKAFALILLVFLFFTSDFYKYTVLGAPKPIAKSKLLKENNSRTESDKLTNNNLESKNSLTESITELNASKENIEIDSIVKKSVIPEKLIKVNSKLLNFVFTTKGAIASSVKFPEYKNSDSTLIDIIPNNSEGIFNLFANNTDLDKKDFEYNGPLEIEISEIQQIDFTYTDSEGWQIIKRFTFNPNSYEVNVELIQKGIKVQKYKFGWKSAIVESEQVDGGLMAGGISYSDAYISLAGEVDNPVDKDEKKTEIEGRTDWVAVKSKFFAGIFVLEKDSDVNTIFKVHTDKDGTNAKTSYSFEIVDNFEKENVNYKVILTPNKYSILSSYDINLEEIVFSGYTWFFRADLWFPKLCGFMLYLLNFFYSIIPNYGIAILFLTLFAKIATYPLTAKGTKSMAGMKELAPKIKEIKEKHKNDPLKVQKATMELYKKEGVNPFNLGGCLPMVANMPVFIALFITLRKSIELRGAPFMLWINDLSVPEEMFMLPTKILFYGPNVSLLAVIMAVSMYFQSKMTMTDPNQKMMLYLMPVMMLFMGNGMPAGLVLYWSFSNILTIAQNKFLVPNPSPKNAVVVKTGMPSKKSKRK